MLGNKTKRIFGLFLTILMTVCMVLPITVFADPFDDLLVNVVIEEGVGGTDCANIKDAIKEVNKKYASSAYEDTDTIMYYKSSGEDIAVARIDTSTGTNRFQICEDGWKELKGSERTNALEKFSEELIDSGADEDALHSFMNDIQDQDGDVASIMIPMVMNTARADIWAAYKVVKPFMDVLNVILGVGCVLLILLLFGSTVLDLAYIGLPVWREAQANKEGGNGKHPFGVSYEAITTVQEIEKGIGGGDGGYKNSYLLYFKRRALTYIILAVCIMYLICGGISGIIAFVLNLTSGMVM